MSKESPGKTSQALKGIEESIANLVEVRETVCEFYETHSCLDDFKKGVWDKSLKQLVSNTIAATEMVRAISKGKYEVLDSVEKFLNRSDSCAQQVYAALKTFEDREAEKLQKQLEKAHNRCASLIVAAFNRLGKQGLFQRQSAVVAVSNDEFHLNCSVCNDIAAVIKIGNNKQHQIFYKGLTLDTELPTNGETNNLREWLKAENLAMVHQYLEEEQNLDFGLDAYDPVLCIVVCERHARWVAEKPKIAG